VGWAPPTEPRAKPGELETAVNLPEGKPVVAATTASYLSSVITTTALYESGLLAGSAVAYASALRS
jgi:hypothetical protein